MEIGFWICTLPAVLFLVVGILFAVGREKAVKWVSGFNTLPQSQQEQYDRAAISRDMRNQCFLWAAVLFAGAVLSCLISPFMAIPAWISWLVLFFREVHLDPEKAFDKYRLP